MRTTVIPFASASFIALFVTLTTAPVSAQSGLDHFNVSGCDTEFANKVWTSLHYLETALDSGIAVHRCVNQAGRNVVPLSTRHEFTSVGPYVPCNSTDSRYRERPEAYTNPGAESGAALYQLIRMFASDYPGTINIVCSSARSETAWTSDRFGHGHTRGGTIYLGTRTWGQRPDHQPLSLGADRGQTFDYANIEPSYPVEELAGIIAHELLHTHNYSHGDESGNQCRYTSWDCSSSSSSRSCRANSMLEIIEACVSEVVEQSVAQCPYTTAPVSVNWQGPMRATPVLYGYDSSCRAVLYSEPRDGFGFSQAEYENNVDRMGGDYSAVSSASPTACRALCVGDSRCRAFTFVPSTNTCWLKDSVPAPRVTSGMTSGFVRVAHGENTVEYAVDRPGRDYRSQALAGSTAFGDCMQLCISEDRCRAFSFVVQASDGSGQCWLKDSIPAAVSRANIVSYRKPLRLVSIDPGIVIPRELLLADEARRGI